MSQVFADNPDIKVVGDRFVFQSEVLFASGSADIGDPGKRKILYETESSPGTSM